MFFYGKSTRARFTQMRHIWTYMNTQNSVTLCINQADEEKEFQTISVISIYTFLYNVQYIII